MFMEADDVATPVEDLAGARLFASNGRSSLDTGTR